MYIPDFWVGFALGVVVGVVGLIVVAVSVVTKSNDDDND